MSDSIIGSAGDDAAIFCGALANTIIDLNAGNDEIVLSTGANSAFVFDVETIIGGSGADDITMRSVMTNGIVNLGTGTERLFLATGINTLTVTGVEFLTA